MIVGKGTVSDEPSISSRHGRGAHVLFTDGSVRMLKDSTDPETIKALTTIAGGEDVSEFTTNDCWTSFAVSSSRG